MGTIQNWCMASFAAHQRTANSAWQLSRCSCRPFLTRECSRSATDRVVLPMYSRLVHVARCEHFKYTALVLENSSNDIVSG